MKITSAEFAATAVGPQQYPVDGLPEFALVGRSNVGKSSIINTLAGRKALARTSSQPGKTRTLNFYRLNQAFYLVDLPGYGYARVSKTAKAQWAKTIEGYLQKRRQLIAVLQVVDLRHPPTQDDVMMFDWLRRFALPIIVAANKADKVPRGKWPQHLKEIVTGLNAPAEIPVILFSAATGQGKEEILAYLEKFLQ